MKKWKRAEKKANKHVGVKDTPGSGCGYLFKGDGLSRDYMVETKFSAQVSESGEPYISIKSDWFEKAKKQALMQGAEPVIALTLANMEQFYFRYSPDRKFTKCELIQRTRTVYLSELISGKYDIITIKETGDVWTLEEREQRIDLKNQSIL